MEYLANKGVLIDAYCGWQLAYDDIYNNKADIEKRKDVYEKICNNAIYIVLEGFESHSTYSYLDCHLLTLDFVNLSFLNKKIFLLWGMSLEKLK